MNIPELLILDTRDDVLVLDTFLKTLPAHKELTADSCVCGIFSFLSDKDNARENVLEYLYELEEKNRTSNMSESDMVKMTELLYQVAEAIWRELVKYGVFTPSGCNWYYAVRLINYDLMLQITDDKETLMEDLYPNG